MKKLSSEKRKQLLLVLGLTVIVMVGLWFGVISAQTQKLGAMDARKVAAAKKLDQVKAAVESAPTISNQLKQAEEALDELEADMASGDLNSWAFNTIRLFKASYKVDIPQFSRIDGPKEVNLLPKFPYSQAGFTVAGTAHFHDLGRFLADFENQFPYFRIANLTLEPAPATSPSETERLAFKMEVLALVKPGNS